VSFKLFLSVKLLRTIVKKLLAMAMQLAFQSQKLVSTFSDALSDELVSTGRSKCCYLSSLRSSWCGELSVQMTMLLGVDVPNVL
jgi:hypothetical protein